MGKKISFNKIAKVCLDYVNQNRQNSIWGFKRENLPDPAKVFYQYAAEKTATAKAIPPEKVQIPGFKVKTTPNRRKWKQRRWKNKRKNVSEAKIAKI